MQYFNLNKDFNDIDDYYEVEKIITRKSKGKNKLYLIKWFGYPIADCTWEPISHLGNINTLVEKFDDNFPNSIDKRQLRKYLHSINKGKKGNKNIFKNRNKINPKNYLKNENIKNNNIIIELEDSTIKNKNANEVGKDNENDVLIERVEISEGKYKDNNIETQSLYDSTKENTEIKLIKPIII